MRGRTPSLFQRMTLLFVLVGLVPLLLGGGEILRLVRERTLADLEHRQLSLAGYLALEVREILKLHEAALVHVGSISRRMEELLDSAHFIPFFRDHLEAFSIQGINMEACALLGREGALKAIMPPREGLERLELSSLPEVKGAVRTGLPCYSPVVFHQEFHEPMVRLAVPTGPTIVLGFIPVGSLSARLQAIPVAAGMTLLVTDREGNPVSHPDSSVVARGLNLRELPPVSFALDAGKTVVRYEQGGERWAAAVSGIPDLGWTVIVAERESRALALSRELLEGLLVVLALAVLVAVAVAYPASCSLRRPIERLVRAFEGFGRGDHPGDLPGSSFREFEVMIRSFDQMATQVRAREEALKSSEERYRLVVENSTDMIVVVQDGFVRFVNRIASDFSGRSREELVSRPFSEFIHPEDRQMVMDYHARRMRGEPAPHRYTFRVLKGPEEEVRVAEIKTIPVSWEGRPASLCFLTDVTERIKREEALRESEERYRTLVENSPDGIYMAELPEGRIRFVNRAVCEMFGCSPQEALSMKPWDVLVQEEVPRARHLLKKALEGHPMPAVPFSFKALHKDGSALTVEVRFARVRYQGRDAIQAMVRDVTEHELLERQLQHSQRMQALGTLASGVAHEFNNILAAIQGFAQLMGYTLEASGEDTSNVQEIVSCCERAASLTHKMLTFARADDSDRVILKVNHIVERTREMLSRTLPPIITVKTDLTGGLPFVQADPTQLEQVLLNLGLNARDAMGEEGGVIIMGTKLSELDAEFCREHSYVVPGTYVELYVMDDGAGIPAEIRERIFDPFFTTKEPGKGTGLGLSISYSIVKNHGGFITAESPPRGRARGSILRVFLPPMETEGEHRGPAGPEPVNATMGRGERILAADDEPAIRNILERALRRQGYRVETVQDGYEAVMSYLRALNEGRPFDAVIMDLSMPVRDGIWASMKILEADPGARILIATGRTDMAIPDPEPASRLRAVLKKPFNMAILFETLNECLKSERSC